MRHNEQIRRLKITESGVYDLVIIGEAPDDQTILAFTLALARAGNVTSTTMRALSEEEFAQVVARLP